MDRRAPDKQSRTPLMARLVFTWQDKHHDRAPNAGPHRKKPQSGPAAPLIAVKTQADIDNIPANQRGISFFTSMPASRWDLVPIEITLGALTYSVHASPRESALIQDGKMPLVRCFASNGKVVPWYEQQAYRAHLHYIDAESVGWTWPGSPVVACWSPAESIDFNIERYYEAAADMATIDEIGEDWTAQLVVDARSEHTPILPVLRLGPVGRMKRWSSGSISIARRRRGAVAHRTWSTENLFADYDIARVTSELDQAPTLLEALDQQGAMLRSQGGDALYELMAPKIDAERRPIETRQARLRRQIERILGNRTVGHSESRPWIKAVGIPGDSCAALHAAVCASSYKAEWKRPALVKRRDLTAVVVDTPQEVFGAHHDFDDV